MTNARNIIKIWMCHPIVHFKKVKFGLKLSDGLVSQFGNPGTAIEYWERTVSRDVVGREYSIPPAKRSSRCRLSGPFLAALLIALCILPLGLDSGVARHTMDGGRLNSPGNATGVLTSPRNKQQACRLGPKLSTFLLIVTSRQNLNIH